MNEYYCEYLDEQENYGRVLVSATSFSEAFHVATAVTGSYPVYIYAAR